MNSTSKEWTVVDGVTGSLCNNGASYCTEIETGFSTRYTQVYVCNILT